MDAYAIFDGGGIKCAALAGCFQASCDRDFKFVGFGGTSAGSIVATLAAVGYSGTEILNVLKHTDFAKMLFPDRSQRFSDIGELASALGIMSSSGVIKGVLKAPSVLNLIVEKRKTIKALYDNCGLYDIEPLGDFVIDLVKKKFPQLNDKKNVTFGDLDELGVAPLKITATNTSTGQCVVFSKDDHDFSSSLKTALCASCCYPFVFRPIVFAVKQQFADGGISSNLPTFLFEKESNLTRTPILAFDLVRHAGDFIDKEADIKEYSSNVLSSCLGASDVVMSEMNSLVTRVTVPISSGISTFPTHDDRSTVDSLFNSGAQATNTAISSNKMFAVRARAGEAIILQLRSMYGDQKHIYPILAAFVEAIERQSSAEKVRASIMLPTGRTPDSRIVTYYCGFARTDTDRDLELSRFGGSSGMAIRDRRPIFQDLNAVRVDYENFGLTKEQQDKVPSDRNAIFSIPIFAHSKFGAPAPDLRPIVGTLSADTVTPFDRTGWTLAGGKGPAEEIVNVALIWAEICGKMLS